MLSRLMDKPPPDQIENLLLVALHRLEQRPPTPTPLSTRPSKRPGSSPRRNLRALVEWRTATTCAAAAN